MRLPLFVFPFRHPTASHEIRREAFFFRYDCRGAYKDFPVRFSVRWEIYSSESIRATCNPRNGCRIQKEEREWNEREK